MRREGAWFGIGCACLTGQDRERQNRARQGRAKQTDAMARPGRRDLMAATTDDDRGNATSRVLFVGSGSILFSGPVTLQPTAIFPVPEQRNVFQFHYFIHMFKKFLNMTIPPGWHLLVTLSEWSSPCFIEYQGQVPGKPEVLLKILQSVTIQKQTKIMWHPEYPFSGKTGGDLGKLDVYHFPDFLVNH